MTIYKLFEEPPSKKKQQRPLAPSRSFFKMLFIDGLFRFFLLLCLSLFFFLFTMLMAIWPTIMALGYLLSGKKSKYCKRQMTLGTFVMKFSFIMARGILIVCFQQELGNAFIVERTALLLRNNHESQSVSQLKKKLEMMLKQGQTKL